MTVAPTKDGALVRWEALVLVDRGKSDPLARAEKPETPEEAKPWTRSTACVQSDDPAIREKADELAKGTEGLEAYARRVIAFTSHHQGKPGVSIRRTRRPQRAGLRRVVHQPCQPGRGAVASKGDPCPHRRPSADLVRPVIRALAGRVLASGSRLGVARIVAGQVPATAMQPGRAQRGQPGGRRPSVRSAAMPPGHAGGPPPLGAHRVRRLHPALKFARQLGGAGNLAIVEYPAERDRGGTGRAVLGGARAPSRRWPVGVRRARPTPHGPSRCALCCDRKRQPIWRRRCDGIGRSGRNRMIGADPSRRGQARFLVRG